MQKLTFRLAEVTCKAQVSADEGNDSEVEVNTDIVLSLGDKVRRTLLNRHYGAAYKKSLQKKTKIKVHVEGPYHSNPTININVGRAHFSLRGTKHKREIEGVGETAEIHVQVKKARK